MADDRGLIAHWHVGVQAWRIAMNTIVREDRPDTITRWWGALDRAHSDHLEARRVQGTNIWVVNSGTDPHLAYTVTPESCTCPAGRFHDPVCKHRAALKEVLR